MSSAEFCGAGFCPADGEGAGGRAGDCNQPSSYIAAMIVRPGSDPAANSTRRAPRRQQGIPDYGLRWITVTRPSLPFCLGARDIALGLASPLAGGDDAVESAADCVQKRVVAERAADQLAPPQRGEGRVVRVRERQALLLPAGRRQIPSHAPRDLEEQPAANRDANRPEDERINDVGHQTKPHGVETNLLRMSLLPARVKRLRRRLVEFQPFGQRGVPSPTVIPLPT